jgi:hypothetical protein
VTDRRITSLLIIIALLMTSCAAVRSGLVTDGRVDNYFRRFPYQDTHDYAKTYTKGDPANFNVWVLGKEPVLVKAGQDKVVRMNNDTYYKIAFVNLAKGPVVLTATESSPDRFSSFQLMDDRNVNYHNVVHPKGTFTLHSGDEPGKVDGEAIGVPSPISVVIVRVEVKNKNDEQDVAEAKRIFAGIKINGPTIDAFPDLDLLSDFDVAVGKVANEQMDEVFRNTPFRELVAGPNDVPDKVSYLRLAAGTKGGWGGPVTSHSSYETLFYGADGKKFEGRNGTYSVTTEEPPVDAFWSATVYDTEAGGHLHPNAEDRYHINGTTAVKNADGTVTLTFKQSCGADDLNCLEVPAGEFDIAARYYLPHESIQSGEWTLPKIALSEK